MSNWTFFSNHGHVLFCLTSDPEARLRDVAADVGITERAVQKIVRDLQDNGMITISKNGRRNRYQIHRQNPLRHDLEAHCTLGDLVSLVSSKTAVERVTSRGSITAPSDPVKTEAPRFVEPGSVEPEPVHTGSVKPEPDQPEPDQPDTDRPGRAERRPAEKESGEPDALQQGTLF